MRSPTAECVFRDRPGLEVKSAGIDRDARIIVSAELVEWADIIFTMENHQRNVIRRRFAALTPRKRIVSLRIPDEYDFMDAELITILEGTVGRYLARPARPAEGEE